MTLDDAYAYYVENEEPAIQRLRISLEARAKAIISDIQQTTGTPTATQQNNARQFLIDIETWKASCIDDRRGYAEQNSAERCWNALRDCVRASHTSRLDPIMQLTGFGSVPDPVTGQRRAKVASAVLRFLYPIEWGVVDWRNQQMIINLHEANLSCDRALEKSWTQQAHDLRDAYDIMDQNAAINLIGYYHQFLIKKDNQLNSVAEVDMAIFGLSLLAWPMKPANTR